MHIERFTSGTAGSLAASTGYDRFFTGSVRAARVLSLPTGGVALPDTVDLATDRPLLFAANHSSLFDLVASLISLGHFGLTARIGVNARFFANPVGGSFLRRLGCIPFSREGREQAEEAMVGALEAGQAGALMPEGRIVKPQDRTDGVGTGRPGVSRIARLVGAAVVPVGIAGSDRVWPPGSARVRVGWRRSPVVVRFGPPMLFGSDDHAANVDALMVAIATAHDDASSASVASASST